MEVVRYCTPEWLEESSKYYQATPRFQEELKKITTKVFFRIEAEPAWGIEEDIIFGVIVNQGQLLEMGFFNEEQAKKEAEFIMAATPQEWKKLLRKENKFMTDFMVGKVVLEQGSKVGIFSLAPHANTFIDGLTPCNLQFQDEMSPEELENFRSYMREFREALSV